MSSLEPDDQSRALKAAWVWMLEQGRRTISVEEYNQLRLADEDLPDVDAVYRLFGNWGEFETSARAFAALMQGPQGEPAVAPIGPRSRPSGLAGRVA